MNLKAVRCKSNHWWVGNKIFKSPNVVSCNDGGFLIKIKHEQPIGEVINRMVKEELK